MPLLFLLDLHYVFSWPLWHGHTVTMWKYTKNWNPKCEHFALHVHCKCMIVQGGVSGQAFHMCSEVIVGSYYYPLWIMPYV